ncbi:DUF3857 domain-containing protein [Maribacter sp. MAR_2009_72]|uniref:DUF3857 domain-containing protein n=1 Tax=Maribacter sp. MAR_2009_72 TaxID=1250050 RepID=UPI00119BB764|nr:DUF3857 domain-containing protein [Maribacter sp. MAR_2009_72]TVZ15302.1 uncharacterized protein DUF3857 [Maribacter sp. MAR_2009_72]
MSLKKVITFQFILFFSFCINAQNYEFGEVSKEELLEEAYATDSSAVAAYLYKYRKTYYIYSSNSGLSLVTEIHERVKIYSNEGFSYATKVVNLSRSSSDSESISKVKGSTYTMENGKVVESKLEKDGIFKSEYSKSLNQVKLTMPNVKVGSVLEYRYKIISPYIQSIDEFRFQEEVPIKKLKASMSIFDYFKFNQRQKGFLLLNPQTKGEMNTLVGTHDVVTTYNLKNIPALKDESFVSNIDNYRSGVNFEIVSLQIPGQIFENYAQSWEDVVKTIYESNSFGSELNKKNYFEEELDAELDGIVGDDARMEKVLEFVKRKIKWNKKQGVGTDEGVKKAYKNHSGNSGDINLILVSALKHAGLNASPIILSTRDNGVQLFPTLNGFNYVIAGIKDGDKYKVLDATEDYSAVNVLPLRDLNWFGRAINEDGTAQLVDLMPENRSLETTMLELKINDDGSVEGSNKQRFSEHYAMLLREKYKASTEEKYIEDLEKQYSGIEISDFNIADNDEPVKPLSQSFELYWEDGVEDVGDKLYFSPLFYLATDESPFKSKKREFPIDFGYPWEDRFLVKIKCPEGYKVESLPENTRFALPNGIGSFMFKISFAENVLQLSSSITMKNALIKSEYYDALREFYRQIIEKQAEKVVLSKV